jgi:hypothetical protein
LETLVQDLRAHSGDAERTAQSWLAAVALAEISPEDGVYVYSHTRACMARKFV